MSEIGIKTYDLFPYDRETKSECIMKYNPEGEGEWIKLSELRRYYNPEVKRGNEGHDPYLQPGWPCEVWDEWGVDCHLRYYSMGGFVKKFSSIGEIAGMEFSNYRPIGTEWDFAPEWADRLVIETFGKIRFYGDMMAQPTGIDTVLPEMYHGQTIPRPEWAKGNE